jgi:hypothetical protein
MTKKKQCMTSFFACAFLVMLMSRSMCVAADDAAPSHDSKSITSTTRLQYDEMIWPWQEGYVTQEQRMEAMNELTKSEGSYCVYDAVGTAIGRTFFRSRYSYYDDCIGEGIEWIAAPLFQVEKIVVNSPDMKSMEGIHFFPEVRQLHLRLSPGQEFSLLPIQRCEYLQRLSICSAGGEGAVSVDIEGMQVIAGLSDLQVLNMADVDLSDEMFSHLVGMQKLRYLNLYRTNNLTPQIFNTIATWPRVEYITIVEHPSFNAPVDEETANAIASLNGRVRYVRLLLPEEPEEYGTKAKTVVHPSLINAISNIQSLEFLSIGEIEGGATRENVLPLMNIPDYENVIQYQTFPELHR